ncbi:MAG: glycosyltransferase family 4 protein [Patescibacteria group bacterium]
MKIAFIGQKGIPAKNGGVERYVESLATKLVDLNQTVFVYNRYDYLANKISEFKGINIINKRYLPGKNVANITHTFLSVLDVLKRDVDIIHFQGIGPSLLCWLPKLLKPKIKIVGTLHSFDYGNDKWGGFAKFMLRQGEKLMCKYADEVIVLTIFMRDYIKTKYNRDAVVIPNGANLYENTASDKIAAWHLKPGKYILSVSRIIKLKGLQYLIAAYKNLETDKKLVITGDGEYLKELKKIVGDDQRVIFTGNQNNETLDQLYANAYLFVQSSEMEGLSIALLEAMAHRVPCLVSDISANLEVIKDYGYSFKVNNLSDLKNSLKNLLDNPEDLTIKADLAYRRVKEFYSWTSIAEKVLEVYKK